LPPISFGPQERQSTSTTGVVALVDGTFETVVPFQ